jgi:Trk K+ transport system NAD-binding subunit
MVVDRRQQAAKGEVGDAQDESVLTRAGVGEAQFCIVALNDDNVNIFTTLMARNLNPTTRILARANEPASVDKLYRAGADYVALLPTIGGQTLARIVLSDTVTVILDLPNGDKAIMKRMRHRSPTTVGRIERATGVLVIGIEDGVRQIVSPAQDDPVAEGEAVIVVGGIEHLKRFIHFG